MDWDKVERDLLIELQLQYSGFSQFRIDQILSLKGRYRGDNYEKYWQDKRNEIHKAALTEYENFRKRYLGDFDFSGFPNSRIINRAMNYVGKRLSVGVDRKKGLDATSWCAGMLYFEWTKLAIGEGFVCKPFEIGILISIAALTLHDLTDQLDDDEHSRAMVIGLTELSVHLIKHTLERENPTSVKGVFCIVKGFLDDLFQGVQKMIENLLGHSECSPSLILELKEVFQRLDNYFQTANLEMDQLADTFEDWERMPQTRVESTRGAIKALQETQNKDFAFKYKYQWIGIYEVMCEHHLLSDNEKSTFCHICNSPDNPNYFLPEDEHELPNAYVPGESWEKDSTWHQLSAHRNTPRQRLNIDKTKREFELLLKEYGVI